MNRGLYLAALAVMGGAWATTPSLAAADAEGRAVATCRADLLARFEPGQIRSYRIAEIGGSSRSTRVTFVVDADRRYTLVCATDRAGQIVTATIDPPRAPQARLADGSR